jgi:O-antigen/teichoic acid export membrane protein
MNSNQSGSIFRLSRLRLSYISGAASKICSILLQILIVPLAISSVGIERFGIFIMIVSACVWLELGGIGIGPGLTHSLSVAWSSGSKINEKSIFSMAFYLSLIISILVLIFNHIPV